MNSARIKIFLLVLLFTIYYLLFTIPAFAQTNTYSTSNTNPDVPKNLHTYTQTVMIETMSALMCQITGTDPINPRQSCLGVDSSTHKIGFVQNSTGAIGMMSGMITMLYTPPLHTVDYFAYLGNNFGITKSAYAQSAGIGFTGLHPLMKTWTVFRNFVYLLFIIIFVVIGMAIMLRIKIDPRTVMSIENQIPKIIIGILLVTFSFAIAGFMIDLMYLFIYLMGNLLGQIDPQAAAQSTRLAGATDPFQAANLIGAGRDGNPYGLARIASGPANQISGGVIQMLNSPAGKVIGGSFGGLIGLLLGAKGGGGSILPIIAGALGTGLSTIVSGQLKLAQSVAIAVTLPTTIVAGAIGKLAGSGTAGTLANAGLFAAGGWEVNDLLGLAAWLITWIIVTIALLFALFRVWFTLLQAYVFVLIDIVFAPFWILGGLIPGSPMGFSGWIRSLMGNLSGFPVTVGMFMLGDVFMKAFGTAGEKTQFSPPLAGSGDTSGTGVFIGLGIILLTPQAVQLTKDLFKSPQNKYGAAVFQTIGVGASAVNVPEHAKRIAMLGYYKGHLRSAPLIGKFFGKEGTTTNVDTK